MGVTVIKAKQKKKERLRVAAYCRVSSDRDEQESSIENQITFKENNYMDAANKEQPVQRALPESTWNYIVEEMKTVFRFTRKETKWFKNCKTAKLIATIPFAAG